MSTAGSTGTSVLAGVSVDDGSGTAVNGGAVGTVSAGPTDVLAAAVSGAKAGCVGVDCALGELEHAARKAGTASHSERDLGRLMIGNCKGVSGQCPGDRMRRVASRCD